MIKRAHRCFSAKWDCWYHCLILWCCNTKRMCISVGVQWKRLALQTGRAIPQQISPDEKNIYWKVKQGLRRRMPLRHGIVFNIKVECPAFGRYKIHFHSAIPVSIITPKNEQVFFPSQVAIQLWWRFHILNTQDQGLGIGQPVGRVGPYHCLLFRATLSLKTGRCCSHSSSLPFLYMLYSRHSMFELHV